MSAQYATQKEVKEKYAYMMTSLTIAMILKGNTITKQGAFVIDATNL